MEPTYLTEKPVSSFAKATADRRLGPVGFFRGEGG